VIVVGATVLVVLPWFVRNELAVGSGVGLSTTGGVNFYVAHAMDGPGYGWTGYEASPPEEQLGEDVDEPAASRRGYELGFEALRDDPGRLISTTARGTTELYSYPGYSWYFSTRAAATESPYPPGAQPEVRRFGQHYARYGWYALAGLSLCGVVWLARSRRRALGAIAALSFANWLCFAVVFWGTPRYRFAVEPLLCLLAAAGLVAIGRLLVGPTDAVAETRAVSARPSDDVVVL
jgi:hypothetical protein